LPRVYHDYSVLLFGIIDDLLDGLLYGSANNPGPQIILTENKEWHGFISEEGENMYKNYKLENMFYHFTGNTPQLLFVLRRVLT